MGIPIYGGNAKFFVAMAIFGAALFFLWRYLRARKAPAFPNPTEGLNPFPVRFTTFAHVKAALSNIFLFMTVWWEKPGLYYTGNRADAEKGPVLVTANNFLTLYLLGRAIEARPIRILVIDTRGVNVWCSAGKGQFSAEEIIDKARKTGLLAGDVKPKLILPKFSLAGVKLSTLRANGIAPRIGPFYARGLPAYLDGGTFPNMYDDRAEFGLGERLFTAPATAMQFLFYFLSAYVATLGILPLDGVVLAVVIAFFYPLLFPFLPGDYFSAKGLSMGVLMTAIGLTFLDFTDPAKGISAAFVPFAFGTSIFVGLSYTGNSAVSNYTDVRKETRLFLPLVPLLYLLSAALYLFL